jgi:hypothetical protein
LYKNLILILNYGGHGKTVNTSVKVSHHFSRSPIRIFISHFGASSKTEGQLAALFKEKLNIHLKEKEVVRLREMLEVASRDLYKKTRKKSTRQIQKKNP